MNIHIHVHNHPDEETKKSLQLIINKIDKIMPTLADIQAQNTALIAAVAEEDSVIDSAVTLISGFGTTLSDIKAQLAAAVAANDPTAIQGVVDSLTSTIADVTAKKQALADAVAANTPAA